MGHTVPLLLAVALLSVACGPARTLAYQQTDTQQQETYLSQQEREEGAALDSILYRFQSLQQEMTELKATFAESIPAAQAQLTIPTQNLIDLPEGAKYGASRGRANVEAQRQGDTIILTGRCDSVARQCALYERQAFRKQNTIDSLSNVIHSLNSKIDQMAFEAASNTSRTTLATEPGRPPCNGSKWFAAGAILGIIGAAGAHALWKKFRVGTLIKGLITKFK